MDKINHGVPAFPREGMTLREWYAGQALAAFTSELVTSGDVDFAVKLSVKAADALIYELEKETHEYEN